MNSRSIKQLRYCVCRFVQDQLACFTIGGCSGKRSPRSHGPSRSVAGRVGLGPRLRPSRAQRVAAPLALHLMSKEVAGQPEDTSLLDCIELGTVPFPGRMSYVQWLKWGKDTGTRPLKNRPPLRRRSPFGVGSWSSSMTWEKEKRRKKRRKMRRIFLPPRKPSLKTRVQSLFPMSGMARRTDAPAAATTGLAAAGDGALAMVAVPADRRGGPSVRPLRWDPCLLRLRPCRQSCVRCSARTKSRWWTTSRALRASSWRSARMALRFRRVSLICSRRRPRSLRRSSARSVATSTRPEWSGVCGPGFRSQRLRKGMTAMLRSPEGDPSDR